MSDWVKRIQQAEGKKSISPVGLGWYTMKEWQQKLGFGDNKTRRYIRQAMEDGEAKVFMGLKENTCGIMSRQIWYKLND